HDPIHATHGGRSSGSSIAAPATKTVNRAPHSLFTGPASLSRRSQVSHKCDASLAALGRQARHDQAYELERACHLPGWICRSAAATLCAVRSTTDASDKPTSGRRFSKITFAQSRSSSCRTRRSSTSAIFVLTHVAGSHFPNCPEIEFSGPKNPRKNLSC